MTASDDEGITPGQAARAERPGFVQAHFESLLSRNPALRFLCLSTADGVLLEHHCASPSVEAARVAAMTASALALSESFARSAVQSPCDYSVISTEGGAIVMVRVPAGARALALAVGSDGSEVLAVTLRTALDTSRRIAAALS